MGKHGTKIQWTHFPGHSGETWNPIAAHHRETGEVGWHCEKISPGCRFCYAETMNLQRPYQRGTSLRFDRSSRHLVEFKPDRLVIPVRHQKPRCYFVMSMTDPFLDAYPRTLLDDVTAVSFWMRRHLFLYLTKRSEEMMSYFSLLYNRGSINTRQSDFLRKLDRFPRLDSVFGKVPSQGHSYNPEGRGPANILLGVSVEDQERADLRRDHLQVLSDLGFTTFVSYEPAIGPVDWTGWEFLDWMLMGGESGGKEVRPSSPVWFRETLNWCEDNDVSPFFKQWGSYAPRQDDTMEYVGPHSSSGGDLLDGKAYHGFPDLRSGLDRLRSGKQPLLF